MPSLWDLISNDMQFKDVKKSFDYYNKELPDSVLKSIWGEATSLPEYEDGMQVAKSLTAKSENPMGMNDLQVMGMSGVPVFSDIAGFVGDMQMMIENPEERTWANAGLAGLGALPFVPPMAGIIAGRKAKNLKPEVLEMAESMKKAGKSRDDIWAATGELGQPAYFDPVDGSFRFEIDDSNYQYLPDQLRKNPDGYKSDMASRGIYHPEMFEAYPELKNVKLVDYDFKGDAKGQYSAASGYFDDMPATATVWESPNKESVMLHELGAHGIQDLENFAKGGNTRQFAKKRTTLWDENPQDVARLDDIKSSQGYDNQIDKSNDYFDGEHSDKLDKAIDDFTAGKITGDDLRIKRDEIIAEGNAWSKKNTPLLAEADSIKKMLGQEWMSPFQQYERQLGEVDARMIQDSMGMTMDERIAKPPWERYDIPEEEIMRQYRDDETIWTMTGDGKQY